MKMKKKKVGLFIDEVLHEQLKEMAERRRRSMSGLIERWIAISYSKYNIQKEDRQDDNKDKSTDVAV